MSGKLTLKGSIWHFMDPETVKAHGPWVRHSDYAQLEHELAEARKDAWKTLAAKNRLENRLQSLLSAQEEFAEKCQNERRTAEAERDRLAALMPDVLYILANNKLAGDKRAGELADAIRALPDGGAE